MVSDSSSTKILSKRARRAQGPNPSNTWQQQPRIKSASARAKADINYANLGDENPTKQISESRSGSSKLQTMLDPNLSLDSPEVKFGRLLGGTDQRSRHAAVKMLRQYLQERSSVGVGAGLSELDLLKLWKGLWYTLYMADKQPVQDKLSKLLAELLWCLAASEEDDEYAGNEYFKESEGYDLDAAIPDEDVEMEIINQVAEGEYDLMGAIDEESEDEEEYNDGAAEEHTDTEEERIEALTYKHCQGAHLVVLFISTFLQTVRREWGNVDKHRIDKFYTAVRLMISEAYKYLAKRNWNLGIIRLFNDILYEEGLSADTIGLTNGMRYHLIDICVEELAKVNAMHDVRKLTEGMLLDVLEPFFGLAQGAQDKNVQKRVMDKVLLKFLVEYSFVSPVALAEEESPNEESQVFDNVNVGVVSQMIFDIASDPDTDERFRKSLYDMHKTYTRQIRAAGRDVEIIDEVEGEDLPNDKQNNEAEIEEVPESGSSMPQEREPKKKRRKKRKSKDGPDSRENPSQVEDPPKKSKKRKKAQLEEKEEGTSKPVLKQSKKGTTSPPSVSPRAMQSPDQVQIASSSEEEVAGFGKSKRVSFGKMNHCKSHKASMKAVKTLPKQRWDTSIRTPEKGIIRNVPQNTTETRKKKAKRKAKK
mmetsp:Transcript_29262/g.66704  ORF Transcript_29262/g.66704 Transcript_29262/m.66704 type:complete len:647 (-) Transcript_29262:3153-5093(-)